MKNLAVNKDCMDNLRLYKDNEFDLAIVDPPYFKGPNTRQYYGHKISPIGVDRLYERLNHWDVPDKDYFDELLRISRHQIIFGVNYFDYSLPGGRIVWDKCNDSSSFSDCEIAYCSLHNSIKIFRFMWNGMLQGKSMADGHIMQGNKKLNEKRIHPTQKPVALYKWILQTYAEKGHRILDTHLGSGSSRIAAYDMGYDFTGYKIDTDMFRKQQERYERHTQQLRIENIK